MKDFIYIDFEYYNSQNPNLELVSAAWEIDGEVYHKWLHQDPAAYCDLYNYLESIKDTHIIVCYNAMAEGRSLEALGLNCMDFQFYDLYAEWKLLQNRNDKFQYGRYFDKEGKARVSDPGHIVHGKRVNQRDKNIIGAGLADCVGRLLGVDLGKVYKGDSIGVILSRQDGADMEGLEYSEDEKELIIEYNRSDIKYLKKLKDIILKEVCNYHEDTEEVILDNGARRALFLCALAKSESLGMPIHMPYLDNISNNHDKICQEAIDEMNEVYPIYERKVTAQVKDKKAAEAAIRQAGLYDSWPKTSKGALSLTQDELGRHYGTLANINPDMFSKVFTGGYTKKVSRIENFINSLDAPNWPVTDSGRYSTDDKVLGDFRHIPEVDTMRTTNRTIQQVKWFRPSAVKDFKGKIGHDNRIRFFFNPFGSQTGRNQPPAKYFVLAMSSWLRCLMKPEPGYAITACDYSGQEIAIGASLSGDENMKNAYLSGDFYTEFARLAGAIPKEGKRKDYEDVRTIFKAVGLGVGYGMSALGLAPVLSRTMSREVSPEEAQELINKHKKAFPDFWEWKNSRLSIYYRHKIPFILGHNISKIYSDRGDVGDMWTLGTDNPNSLSVANFPIQGTGASIMRSACIKLWKNDVKVITMLHDASYCIHKEGEKDNIIPLISECMNSAAKEFIDVDVRLDFDTYTHHDDYVPPKAYKDFNRFKKYIVGE